MIKELLTKILSKSPQKTFKMPQNDSQETKKLTSEMDINLKILQAFFHLCEDIVSKEFLLDLPTPTRAFIIYAESLCDPVMVNESILKSLMQENFFRTLEISTAEANLPEIILQRLLPNHQTQLVSDIQQLSNFLLSGHLILVIDGYSTAIATAVQGFEQRAVNEPSTEQSIRGPRDSFVENLSTNVSLLRRRISSNRLKYQSITLGELTQTKVGICYIQGIANDKIVEEVKVRLNKIDIDSILDSGYIEELIADESFTLFPLVQNTERPDRTAASLCEGRIAIIVNNTPSVLIVPCTIVSLLQASEDYYNNSLFATLIRIGRFIAINIALLAPAITVAIFSNNAELIPLTFLTSVAGARSDLPFPISIEIILMELTFELLREAGVRLPKTVGQAISTVGGLVIGQAAVTAGIVSPITVIVVSITAIASFVFPDYSIGTSIRILRFVLIILSSILGIFGIVSGLMVILYHLCGLRSFGVPYLWPIAPLSVSDLKDTFFRAPWWAMSARPRLTGAEDPIRQASKRGPTKPDKG
ncbi:MULTISPECIES: spore germination protein [unclassified Dehalobacter]|uniref:spore germination protein n=1 Tax=unclassified Dehalobacter TaxID=2635733 RepID=UPI000E6BD38C|nr:MULTISPECIES: spore germination protein [unclassified Dehalobacter]RJE46777.1 spore gernimation protein GerA [Dehalobacter sp. MCB1]TCX49262.1 spore germination protein [Dehalobacter sp. 14DCB1]TCX49842.1 spore germination protein [Dehalobacter sp. 12DCB1]